MLRTLLLTLTLALAGPAANAFDLQGHRGARGLAPENTLAAFRTAIGIGVDTLELDVHLSADGVPMVVHDPTLNRDLTRDAQGEWLTATGPLIRSLSAAQLQSQYRLGRARPTSSIATNFPEQKASDGERLPQLAEVLALLREPGRETLRANIEIKLDPRRPDDTPPPETIVRAVHTVLREAGVERRVTIQGFDWRALRLSQQLAPQIPTAYLSAQRQNFDTVSSGAWSAGFDLKTHGSLPKMVKAAGGAIWSPNFNDLTPALIAEAHALGLQVLPWTVNQPEDMARLIDWGVDGLITDYPDRARQVMQGKRLPLPPTGNPR
ncbi:glycerophosphodiester phosphodiesterase [Aquincola sp. S2]|uniref:Glycerophosphodiester phosphodiesterase n=1 Tax=Pseudaquabacterium terrae TaxID=2732868 RepID=A0ABX2EK36_9BURK|nr:glycerophosphodiester phosphodiesterase [Aquabacterium terrae]NRF69030.1 glycerophosphodiester phosphodiesterase [Aquabacterium terrae]